jgi:hypothetical protein
MQLDGGKLAAEQRDRLKNAIGDEAGVWPESTRENIQVPALEFQGQAIWLVEINTGLHQDFSPPRHYVPAVFLCPAIRPN